MCKKILNNSSKEKWESEVMETYKNLMKNIVKTEQPESVLLEYVMESLQQDKERIFGEFLRSYFTKKGLYLYFRQRGKDLKYGSLEYYEFLIGYLNWGFEFESLQRLLVTDSKGMCCDAKEFRDSILRIKQTEKMHRKRF